MGLKNFNVGRWGVLRPSLPPFRTLINLTFYIFWLFTLPLISFAQNEDYFDGDYLRYEDRTYQRRIKTVEFHIRNVPLSLPIIKLGSVE